MSQSTTEQRILAEFEAGLKSCAEVSVTWRRRITRADGCIDELIIPENIVTKDGLNAIAANAIAPGTGVNSPIGYLAIGTVTAQHSLGSTVLLFGEVSRKVPITKATSKMTLILTAT